MCCLFANEGRGFVCLLVERRVPILYYNSCIWLRATFLSLFIFSMHLVFSSILVCFSWSLARDKMKKMLLQENKSKINPLCIHISPLTPLEDSSVDLAVALFSFILIVCFLFPFFFFLLKGNKKIKKTFSQPFLLLIFSKDTSPVAILIKPKRVNYKKVNRCIFPYKQEKSSECSLNGLSVWNVLEIFSLLFNGFFFFSFSFLCVMTKWESYNIFLSLMKDDR